MVMGSLCTKAATYYISSTGSDSNTGATNATAWASIDKVNATILYPGDSILFEGGAIFSGSIFFGPSVKGTAQQPIVIGSYGNGRAMISSGTEAGIYVENTAGFKIENLIFKGSGRETNTRVGVDFYMDLPNTKLSYIAIDNVEVYGYREAGICVGSWNGTSGFENVYITNSISHDNGDAGIMAYADDYKIGHRNVNVRNCKVYNNSGLPDKTWSHSGNGIVLGGVDGAIIEYCEAYNNGWLNAWTSGGPVGIWGYLCNNLIIQYNESHHNKAGLSKDGGGFDIDGGSTNSVMQYNYSHDNEGAGYLLAQFDYAPTMKGITIRYNISENDGRKNGYGAIHLWASTKTTGLQDVQIYNNTVYLSPAAHGTPKAVWVQASGKVYATFRNNLFVTTGGVSLMDIQVTANVRFEGNNYWTSGATPSFKWGNTTYTSLAAWRTATKQEMRNGVALGYFLDPEMKNPGQGGTIAAPGQLYTLQGYKLQKSSTMVGKALDLRKDFALNTGETDFWGNSIMQRTDLCIGAHQLTAESKACLQGGLLPLTFGGATEGSYTGPGIQEKGYFDPLTAGIGNHALRYTYTDAAGLTQVLHQTVTVSDATTTSWTGHDGTSGWFEGENWSTCIPTSSINAVIPSISDGTYLLPTVKASESAVVHDLSGDGTITVEQGGSLAISGTLLATNLNAAPHSSLIFQSDKTQYIPEGTFGKLVLQGSGAKKLAGSVTITNLLDLNHTKLTLGDHNLEIDATGSITDFGPYSYFVTDGTGHLTFKAIGPGITRIFPVGTAAGYAPLKLQNKGTTDNFSVRVEEGFKNDQTEGTVEIAGAVDKTWQVTEEVAGGSDVTMALQWNAADELPSFDRESSYVSHYEEGEWNLVENSQGTLAQGTAPGTYSVTVSGVTSFSPFGVVSTNTPPAPLPVTLVAFSATQHNADVILEWATASELNNDGFEVEVSENGKQFRKMAFVKSRVVHSQVQQRYSYRDSEAKSEGARYYRLRQLDLDGTATYSAIRALQYELPDFRVSLYPNPFTDVVTLELVAMQEQELTIQVTDTQGKKLHQEVTRISRGSQKLPIDLSRVPPASICIVTIYLNNTAHHFKLFRE
jgi:hypothetical protein